MLSIDTQTKTILIVVFILLMIYFYFGHKDNNQNETFDNEDLDLNDEESQLDDYTLPENLDENSIDSQQLINYSESNDDAYLPKRDYSPPESEWLNDKTNNRNKSKNGDKKKSSYSEGIRGNLGPSNWSSYFEENNNIVANSQTGNNDNFSPIDETNNGYAVFKSKGKAKCGANQDCSPEELFDVDKYLPQEVNDDWFEVQPEPVSVKNRHLINITKPIGVNTIGTSLKNASYDIRGTQSCPKYVVSPWLQSSIEPDTNLKPL